jgi:hypothetical protein
MRNADGSKSNLWEWRVFVKNLHSEIGRTMKPVLRQECGRRRRWRRALGR